MVPMELCRRSLPFQGNHRNGNILRVATSLSDSAHAVLVLIALRGPSTAYDVKRALARLAGEYWSAPHTQVYRECARLSSAGRDAVVAWVREPTDSSMEIRDVASLKLFAAELSTPDHVRALAERQVAEYRRRLALLDDVEARFGGRPELALRMRNVVMGRAVYEAALAFWEDVAAHPRAGQDA
jgi:PadR family transcriptional regulator AphA